MKPLVLLVEDDTALAQALHWALSVTGVEVRVHPSAEDALAATEAESELPLRLITDLRLPGADGFALSDALSKRLGRPVPTLVISAQSDNGIDQALDARAHVAFAPKPVSIDRIIDWLESEPPA